MCNKRTCITLKSQLLNFNLCTDTRHKICKYVLKLINNTLDVKNIFTLKFINRNILRIKIMINRSNAKMSCHLADNYNFFGMSSNLDQLNPYLKF